MIDPYSGERANIIIFLLIDSQEPILLVWLLFYLYRKLVKWHCLRTKPGLSLSHRLQYGFLSTLQLFHQHIIDIIQIFVRAGCWQSSKIYLVGVNYKFWIRIWILILNFTFTKDWRLGIDLNQTCSKNIQMKKMDMERWLWCLYVWKKAYISSLSDTIARSLHTCKPTSLTTQLVSFFMKAYFCKSSF